MSNYGGKYIGPNNSQMKWYDWVLVGIIVVPFIGVVLIFISGMMGWIK